MNLFISIKENLAHGVSVDTRSAVNRCVFVCYISSKCFLANVLFVL